MQCSQILKHSRSLITLEPPNQNQKISFGNQTWKNIEQSHKKSRGKCSPDQKEVKKPDSFTFTKAIPCRVEKNTMFIVSDMIENNLLPWKRKKILNTEGEMKDAIFDAAVVLGISPPALQTNPHRCGQDGPCVVLSLPCTLGNHQISLCPRAFTCQ